MPAARKVLNFVPRHSDLPSVIRTAWAWHQKAQPLRSREAPHCAFIHFHMEWMFVVVSARADRA